jgi:hypothetical protein
MDASHPKARILAIEAKEAGEAIDAFEEELHTAINLRQYVQAKDFIDAIIEKQNTLGALCETYQRYTGKVLSPVEVARMSS